VTVDRRAHLNERIDIRDTDENFDMIVRLLFGDGDLIEISRIIVVDGAPQQLRQISNTVAPALCSRLSTAKDAKN
jgi:hypothetical protein